MDIKQIAARNLMRSQLDTTNEYRRAAYCTARSPSRQVAYRMLNRLVETFPNQVARVTGVQSAFLRAQQPLGMGGDAVVYRATEHEVTKVHYQTAGLSLAEQHSNASRRQHLYQTLASFLPRYVLPQNSFVAAHPLVFTNAVVQTRQPYVAFDALGIFIPYSDKLDPAQLCQQLIARPELGNQLRDFGEQSIALYQAHRIIPDTAGVQNMVINRATNNLLLIDGQPAQIPEEGVLKALHQLEALGRHLTAAAV